MASGESDSLSSDHRPLQYGDFVFLSLEGQEELYLTADICPEYSVRLLPKEKLPSEVAACLFRVDPYFHVNPWQRDEQGRRSDMHELTRQAVKEMQDSRQGNEVMVGSKILLKHFLSGRCVRLSEDKSCDVIESWQLCLDKKVTESSIISVEQSDKAVPEDTPVYDNSPTMLKFSVHGSASRLMASNGQVMAGKEPTGWRFHLFQSNLSSNEELNLGIPFCLKLKTMGFYLGCANASVTYIDMFNTSALWTLVAEDIISGGKAKSKGTYYLRNIENGLFAGTPENISWQMVKDISSAGKFTILSLSEADDDIDYEEQVKISTADEKLLGVDQKTADAACLATINPSAYSSHVVKSYDIAVDFKKELKEIGVFQVVRFEGSPAQLLLYSSYAITAIKAEQTLTDRSSAYLSDQNSKETGNLLIQGLLEVTHMCGALQHSYIDASINDRELFVKLRLPRYLADLCVTFNQVKSDWQEVDSKDLKECMETAYSSLSTVLIQMMESDLLAREQVKGREGDIINYVNSEPKWVPTIFKMSHDRIEKGVNPEAWIGAIRAWMPSMEDVFAHMEADKEAGNAVFQDLVLSILSGAVLTLGQTNLNLEDLVNVFKEKPDAQIFHFAFRKRGQTVYLNLLTVANATAKQREEPCFVEGEEVFVPLSCLSETQVWPVSLSAYIAMLITYYTNCYTVIGSSSFAALFPEVGLDPETLFLIGSQPQCLFRVRTAAFNFLAELLAGEKQLSKVRFYDEVEVLQSASRFQSSPKEARLCATNNGQMVLTYLSAKAFPSEFNIDGLQLDRELVFVASLLSFTTTIVESGTETEPFQDAIQRCVIWALHGAFDLEGKKYPPNWLAVLISNGIQQGSHLIQKVNKVLGELFYLLLATSRSISETMTKLALAKFASWRVKAKVDFSAIQALNDLERVLDVMLEKRSTKDRQELREVPPLVMLRETVFQAVTAALKLQFTITPEIGDMLLGLFAPVQATLFALRSVVLTKTPIPLRAQLKESMQRRTFEADVISKLDMVNSPESCSAVILEEYSELMRQLRAIERSPIKTHAKTIVWEKKLKYYLLLWDRVYGQINKPNSDEINIPLYQLASVIFELYRCLIQDEPKRVKEFIGYFKPFLYYLDLVDEAWLIRDFSNFLNVTPKQIITFTQILRKRFYQQSLLKAGAFLWIEALLVNSDGSVKKDLQNSAYLTLSPVITDFYEQHGNDDTGSFALCLKMLSLCAYRNQAIQSLLEARVSINQLLGYVNEAERPDVADAALVVLARVHSNRVITASSSTLALLELLERVLFIAKGVFKCTNVSEVIKSGFYSLVKSEKHCNVKGFYYSAEEHKTASLLRLVSDGLPPGPYSGITACIGRVLSTYYQAREGPADRLKTIAMGYRAFLIDFKGFAQDLERKIGPECDFRPLFASIEKGSRWLEKLLKLEKLGNKEADPSLIEVKTTGSGTEATLTKDEDPLLVKELRDFETVLSKQKAWKEVYVANLAASVRKSAGSGKKLTPAQVLKIAADVTTFFIGKEKYIFQVLQSVLSGLDPAVATACYKPIFTLTMSRLLTTANFDEVETAVDFYKSFGNVKEAKRYEQLLEVLAVRQVGSKLLAKIKRSLTVELRLREVVAVSNPRKPKSLTSALRKAKVKRFYSYSAFGRVIRQFNHLTYSWVSLLESWSDNANTPMQRWAANQNGSAISVNIVAEILAFSSGLLELGLRKKSFEQNQQLMMNSLDCLTEFISGPCEENQRTVGESIRMFIIIGEVLKLPYDETFSKEDPDEFIEVRTTAFAVLGALLEGSPSEALMEVYYRFFNEVPIVKYCEDVYYALIRPNLRALELGLELPQAKNDVVNFALNAMVLLVRYCNFSDISVLSVLKTPTAKAAFMDFYARYIGYVEIYQEKDKTDASDKLQSIYALWFIIPFRCRCLTALSAQDLIVNVNHTSQQDKLLGFLNLVRPLEAEMRRQQKLMARKWLKTITRFWDFYHDLAALLVLGTTIYIIVTFESVRTIDMTQASDVFLIFILGIAQIFFYSLGYITYVVEQFPRIVNKTKAFLPEMEMMDLAKQRDRDSVSAKYRSLLVNFTKPEAPRPSIIVNFLTDYYTVKTVAYIAVSIIALVQPLVFPVLLLELAESKPEVRNIFKSVTQNWKQLAVTGILGVILIHMFSTFGYVYFQGYYSFEDGNIKADTLYNAFFSTLNQGIRNGGGLAESLYPPGNLTNVTEVADVPYDYWGLFLFDVVFFIVIIILMLNLVFGIIISTFGELRSARNDLYADINTKCYICGIDRSVIELYGQGWQHHFQIEHSPFAYLAFLIRVLELDTKNQEMSGIETYVLRKFKDKDSNFLPTTSRLIASKLEGKKDGSD